MMTAITDTLEPSPRRITRWGGSFVCALAFHGLVIAAAVLAIRLQDPEDGGVIELDMPPLSVESTSLELENSEEPTDAATAPPPSDADDTAPVDEAKSEPEPVPDTEPEPPEPAIEKAELPEPVEQPLDPSVSEAIVPEPEVVLPKPVEEAKPIEKVEEKPEPKKPEKKKTAERKPDTDKRKDGRKAGPKSDSKAASAAAASGGKFSPNAISRPQPAYPASARASRIEGSVVVRYTVSPSGSVTGVSVLSSSPPGVFNGVTVSAVRNWRFRPSATGGSGTTTIRFKLR